MQVPFLCNHNLQSGIGHGGVIFKETLEIIIYSVLEIVLKKINAMFSASIGKCTVNICIMCFVILSM